MREAKEEAFRLQEALAAQLEDRDRLNSDTAQVWYQQLYELRVGRLTTTGNRVIKHFFIMCDFVLFYCRCTVSLFKCYSVNKCDCHV